MNKIGVGGTGGHSHSLLADPLASSEALLERTYWWSPQPRGVRQFDPANLSVQRMHREIAASTTSTPIPKRPKRRKP